MQRMNIENQQGILYKEHVQRYQFIKPLLKGSVLDVACGVGYGSQIIIDSIDNYKGIDYSLDAIKDAKKFYKVANVNFVQGDILNINEEDESFDRVISFETLEHVSEPEKALREIVRVLKKDGLFMGSVPTQEYDEICEKVYGQNPYHITRFTFTKIKELLSSYFEHLEFYINELLVCNFFTKYMHSEESKYSLREKTNKMYGSIVFVASNDQKLFQNEIEKIKNCAYSMEALVEYDRSKEVPLRETITAQQKLIDERDLYIKELLKERKRIIDNYEKKVAEAIEAIKSQDKLVEERDRYIKELESKLNG